MPLNSRGRPAHRTADDPECDRRRGTRRIARPVPRDDPHAARSNAGAWRPDLTGYRDVEAAFRTSLKLLARRHLELHDEIADLNVMIAAIVDELAPNLVVRNSIGHIGAAQLLLTAGENPDRMRSEASFAALCGVSSVPASYGKTIRHRLNRSGDRAANSALHIIAIGRLRTDQKTKDYVASRITQGHSKLDVISALKRYLAREVFNLFMQRQKEVDATRIAA